MNRIIACYKDTAPITCFQCDNALSVADCHMSVHCESDEICYLEKYTDKNEPGFVKYRGGCRKKWLCHMTHCLGQTGTNKWSDYNVMINCAKCCDKNYCNLKVCDFDKTFPAEHSLRCFDCPRTTNPKDCRDIKICEDTEQCEIAMGNNHKRANGGIPVATSCCNELLCNDYNPINETHSSVDITYDNLFICPTTSKTTISARTPETTTTTTTPTTTPTTKTTSSPTTTKLTTTTTTTPTTTKPTTTPIPVNPTSCYLCAGPPFICESLKSPGRCDSLDQQYCINRVETLSDGTISVNRKCATEAECKSEWWNATSDRHECTDYDPSQIPKYSFTCTYCCTTPNCNENLIPRNLYGEK